MYANGQLPDSVLGPIAQGRLRKDAALRWNAMNIESRRRYGVTIVPLGGMSSYRTYAQQVYLWNNVPHARDPNWVARPGTSNHGWGLAVDLASTQMRSIIDQIGAKYGFAKRWSDAPKEWWHIKWAGFGIALSVEQQLPTIRKGTKNARAVLRLQRLLRAGNLTKVVNGHYGIWTRRAVRRFQQKNNLKVDGVVGPKTWVLLKKRYGQGRR